MTDSQASLTPPSSDTSLPSSQTGTDPVPPNPGSASAKKKKPGKSSTWPVIILIFLLIAFSVMSSLYFWQSMAKQSSQISHLQVQENRHSKRIGQFEQTIKQRFNALQNQGSAQQQQLTKLDKQSLFNTQQLNELGASSRSDWLLAEAEYLLHLANQRLSLEHDFKGAEAILLMADKVLSETNDPGLLPIRQALATETLSLQQLGGFDKQGIYVRLSAMINSLDKLSESVLLSTKAIQGPQPLARTPENSELINTDEPFQWETLWAGIRKDLEKVFSIRRLDQPIEPLLAPEQGYYLKQNLRLMLEQASLALLDQNTPIYQDSLDKASQWISLYFDLRDPQSQALITSLEALKTQEISHELPDISNSLRLLKTKIEEMYQNHRLGRLSTPINPTGGEAHVSEGQQK